MGLPPEKMGLRVTVVIPTLNDAGLIENTVASAKLLGDVQILVVDAGSSDGTPLLAARAGAKVLRTREAGGRQMRRAVAEANGDVLLFLRPGTSLPQDSLQAITDALSAPTVLAGVFPVTVGGGGVSGLLLRAIHRALVAVGVTPFGAPWFVWRTAVDGAAGFRQLAVFEDRDMLIRLRRRGGVEHLQSVALLDDHHAWHRLIWTVLQVPYDMGFPGQILGKFYRKPNSPVGEPRMTALELAEHEAIGSAGAAMP